MDTITPSPLENMAPKVPKDLQGVEKPEEEVIPVYELGQEGNPAEKAAEKDEALIPSSQQLEEAAKKKKSLIENIQASLKIKKPAKDVASEAPPAEEKKTTPDNVWVERVDKVIKLFSKKPKEEQEKAQVLEEGYLKEKHQVDFKDNGDK